MWLLSFKDIFQRDRYFYCYIILYNLGVRWNFLNLLSFRSDMGNAIVDNDAMSLPIQEERIITPAVSREGTQCCIFSSTVHAFPF